MDYRDVLNEYFSQSGRHNLSDPGNLNHFYTWLYNQSDDYKTAMEDWFRGRGNFTQLWQDRVAYLDMLNGKTDPLIYAGESAGTNSASAEKVNDNLISIQNTEDARRWEEYMAQHSLLFNADQLQQLGLSSNGVLQTGAASHSGVGAADNVKSNLTMQKYNEKMNMARSILGMTSQMARAGIMGGALAASKNAAATLTAAASHSALGVLKNMDKRSGFGSHETGQFYQQGDFDNFLGNGDSGYDLTKL